jgi:hypothetical protein
MSDFGGFDARFAFHEYPLHWDPERLDSGKDRHFQAFSVSDTLVHPCLDYQLDPVLELLW